MLCVMFAGGVERRDPPHGQLARVAVRHGCECRVLFPRASGGRGDTWHTLAGGRLPSSRSPRRCGAQRKTDEQCPSLCPLQVNTIVEFALDFNMIDCMKFVHVVYVIGIQ